MIEFGHDTISLALISISRHDETNESSRYGHGEKIEVGNVAILYIFIFYVSLCLGGGDLPTRAHFRSSGLIYESTNHTC